VTALFGHAAGPWAVFSNMNLLLIGATGNTGREITDLALARGHRLTAFVRSPAKITRTDPKLVVKKGDPLDVQSLARAIEGEDAVLSTLGLPPRQALRPSNFMAESGGTTVAAMRIAGVKRLSILSAAVLFPGSGLGYRFFTWLLKHHAKDLSAMETIVAASDLAWTVARPPRLVHNLSERYQARVGALPEGSSTASFRSVAAFMLDAVERREHLGEVVGIVGTD
jgi:putative NADH-flavin reductase